MTAALCAVAGCLFEVHVPRSAGADHWDWAGPGGDAGDGGAAVTLLGHPLPGEPPGSCRFRFRAEQPGDVTLVFRCGRSEPPQEVRLHIAPERVGG